MIRALMLTTCLLAAAKDEQPANSGSSKDSTESTPKTETKAEQTKEVAPASAKKDPLIKTVSEIAALSPKEKEDFRAAGGTAIEDPV